ncbi:unnamed protein product [Discosporangium mesarthrocarpum]
MARQYVEVTCNKPGRAFLATVHRLDRPVSGVMCFARTSKAAARLSKSFNSGEGVEKTYYALVQGHLEGRGTREDFLLPNNTGKGRTKVLSGGDKDRADVQGWGNDWVDPSLLLRSEVVAGGGRGAKLSVLDWEAVCRTPCRRKDGTMQTLLRIRLYTGRKHQIRAQLAAMGYPVVGDVRYGAAFPLPDRSIMLHASGLALPHPTLGASLRLGAPPPGVWQRWSGAEAFSRVGWDRGQGVVKECN